MGLLTDLDAFYTEHRRCGELEAGVDGRVVWMRWGCGARIAQRNACDAGAFGGSGRE
jgi:hypothetical protein